MKLKYLTFALALVGTTSTAQDRIFRDGFERVAPVPPTCVSATIPPYSIREYSWSRVFYGNEWPVVQDSSYLSPVGSFTTKTNSYTGAPAAGLILTVPFTLSKPGPMKLGWLGAQAVPIHNYNTPQRAKSVTVSISPCRADLKAKCSFSASNGNMVYGTTSAIPACVFPLGTKLWLTIHFMDKTTVSPLSNTCLPTNPSNGVRCDAGFKGTQTGEVP